MRDSVSIRNSVLTATFAYRFPPNKKLMSDTESTSLS